MRHLRGRQVNSLKQATCHHVIMALACTCVSVRHSVQTGPRDPHSGKGREEPLLMGAEWLGRETDYSPLSGAEI